MAMITCLLAWLLLVPLEVKGARQLCQGQQPTAQVPAQNSTYNSVIAAILQSGSTNTRGYVVTIYNDGSAIAEPNAAATPADSSPSQIQQFPAGTIDASRLKSLLTQIGDVSTIPTGRCAKSASFGTRTQISYNAKTSGDLQCVRGLESGTQAPLIRLSEELRQQVRDVLKSLNVNTRRNVFHGQQH
jgi:hypothetical protein